MDPISQSFQNALDGGPIERIEIEILPPRRRRESGTQTSRGQFRWKLWSGGRLVFVTTGVALPIEIEAMIHTTNVIVKTTLGINPNAQETPSGSCRN
jgi:hypothetical protein